MTICSFTGPNAFAMRVLQYNMAQEDIEDFSLLLFSCTELPYLSGLETVSGCLKVDRNDSNLEPTDRQRNAK